MKNKKELRTYMMKTLHSISEGTFQEWSQVITEKVCSLPEWKKANTIGLTISGSHEVTTDGLLQNAWGNGKKVVVPKCHPQSKTMTFREITSYSQLEVVYYGLKEPIESQTKAVEHTDIDLLIVPGLCFTIEGYRLGHGGGYYDRYLSHYSGKTLSLAFAVQMVEAIPIEPFDMPVEKIITNDSIIHCHD